MNYYLHEINYISKMKTKTSQVYMCMHNYMCVLYCFKHNIKKLRNNILKSNFSGKPRCLLLNGKVITWDQFKSAFQWDQDNFSLPIHEKLTLEHFELDSSNKMRNHLAEDVLDTKMLFLMQVILKSY